MSNYTALLDANVLYAMACPPEDIEYDDPSLKEEASIRLSTAGRTSAGNSHSDNSRRSRPGP